MSHAFKFPIKDRAIEYRYNPSMCCLKAITNQDTINAFSAESNQPTYNNEAK